MADSEREELLARLAHEHAAYEQRLGGLLSKANISEDEQLEEIRLKKMKLRLKDEMHALEQQRRRTTIVA